jgi:hypothetical protein
MTPGYRGREQEWGPGRWLRERWQYGSVLVLDVDHIICSRDADRGILIEWKHESSEDKTWRIARLMARKLGWWAALFVYSTADGRKDSVPTRIVYEMQNLAGKVSDPRELDEEKFNDWVCRNIGAQPLGRAA